MQLRLVLVILFAVAVTGCDRKPAAKLDPDIARFIAAKRLQVEQTSAAQTNGLPNTVWEIFDAAAKGRFARVTNLSNTLWRESGRLGNPAATPVGRVRQALLQATGLQPKFWPGLASEAWSPVHEVIGLAEFCEVWDGRLMRRFGRDIIDSIPSNSIYFGGTDAGRFIVSALSQSQVAGQPFFTVTQNQLADATYVDYLRAMYGPKIQIPTPDDLRQAFEDYLADAQRRLESNQLKADEDVRVVDSRVQVSGQVAVMAINGRIVYNIFTNNPGREVYIEESFPLDWMYPHLTPHGLILKVNREPLAELSAEIIQRDRAYWKDYTKELIGDWLAPDTSIETICVFSRKVYLNKNLEGFTGDSDYVRNASVNKSFAKLRSTIAGVYDWRARQAGTSNHDSPMHREAEFAYKQALALGPANAETAFRFVNLLLTQNRMKDALQVAELHHACDPKNSNAQRLLREVQSLRASQAANQ